MARVRNWDALSPAYRGRLERGGVTRTAYESGANLAKARGHAATPEHPKEAEKNREKYRAYRDKRNRLVNDIQLLKERWFGDRPSWNAEHSRRAVDRNASNSKPRGTKELQAIYDNLKNRTQRDVDEYWQAQVYTAGEELPDNPLYYH